jgi:hypothetical protein
MGLETVDLAPPVDTDTQQAGVRPADIDDPPEHKPCSETAISSAAQSYSAQSEPVQHMRQHMAVHELGIQALLVEKRVYHQGKVQLGAFPKLFRFSYGT